MQLLASSCLSLHPSVCIEHLDSHWTDFHENWYLRIFLKSVKKIQVSLKLDENKGYFTWWQSTFFIIHCLFLLRMIKVSDKSCIENQNTCFVFSNFFFNRAVYEIMWKNILEWEQFTDDNMAHWHCMLDTSGYKYTCSGFVVFIAFPVQQWLHEHASILRYVLTACLVWVFFF